MKALIVFAIMTSNLFFCKIIIHSKALKLINSDFCMLKKYYLYQLLFEAFIFVCLFLRSTAVGELNLSNSSFINKNSLKI